MAMLLCFLVALWTNRVVAEKVRMQDRWEKSLLGDSWIRGHGRRCGTNGLQTDQWNEGYGSNCFVWNGGQPNPNTCCADVDNAILFNNTPPDWWQDRFPADGPRTPCDQARMDFFDEVSMLNPKGQCKPALDALGVDEKGIPRSDYTCPSECKSAFERLIEACDECATIWKVCQDKIGTEEELGAARRKTALSLTLVFSPPADTLDGKADCKSPPGGDATGTVAKVVQHIYNGDVCGEDFSDSESDCSMEWQFPAYEYSTGYYWPAADDFAWRFKVDLSFPGNTFELPIADTVASILRNNLANADIQFGMTREGQNCHLDIDATIASIGSATGDGDQRFTDLNWDDIPSGRKWEEPYGGLGFLHDTSLFVPPGCKYPFYDSLPQKPLCTECPSVVATAMYVSDVYDDNHGQRGPCTTCRKGFENYPQSVFPSPSGAYVEGLSGLMSNENFSKFYNGETGDIYEHGEHGGDPRLDDQEKLSPNTHPECWGACTCPCSRLLEDIEEFCAVGDCVAFGYNKQRNADTTCSGGKTVFESSGSTPGPAKLGFNDIDFGVSLDNGVPNPTECLKFESIGATLADIKHKHKGIPFGEDLLALQCGIPSVSKPTETKECIGMSCGRVKKKYKDAGCCKNPEKKLTRRLSLSSNADGLSGEDLIHDLKYAKAQGSLSDKTLDEIKTALAPYLNSEL